MIYICIRVQWRVVIINRSFSFDGFTEFSFVRVSLLGDDTAFVPIYFVDAIVIMFCQASVACVHSFFSGFEISLLCEMKQMRTIETAAPPQETKSNSCQSQEQFVQKLLKYSKLCNFLPTAIKSEF